MTDHKHGDRGGRPQQTTGAPGSRGGRNGRPPQSGAHRGAPGRSDFRPAPPASSEVHAPFNFVPLAEQVVLPDWSAAVSHDRPFADGVSGTLEFELTAQTPLLIGGERHESSVQTPGEVRFFQLPDGRYAVPGASLRGMVRNVLEIATFSHMRIVQDQRFSVRNLQNRNVYGRYLTENINGAFKPKAHAGWLRFEAGSWKLYACEHARVEHHVIDAFVRDAAGQKVGQCKKPRDKYDLVGAARLAVRFDATGEQPQDHSRGKKLIYRKVTRLGQGDQSGYLVFTGWSVTKHMEFVFGDAGASVALDEKVVRDFLSIHGGTDEWRFLKDHNPFPAQCGIPVFYLMENDKVWAMGLAQMFKLAYKNSVHDMIRHRDRKLDSELPDFVETLFGRVNGEQETSLRGRVSFGFAICTDRSVTPIMQTPVVLNGPKPSYYPIYVQQKQDGNGMPAYQTYMDKDASISGWKRYPVRKDARPEAPQGDAARNNKIQVRLHPLPSGTRFSGKLRFHNLRPQELGALVWALTWGGDARSSHALGMGKPYGYGRVGVVIKPEAVILPNDLTAKALPLQHYLDAFEHYMLSQVAGWKQTVQLTELLAMADPGQAQGKTLRYMVMGRGRDQNQFVNAEKAGKYLPSFTRAK